MKVLISAPYLVPHIDRFRHLFDKNGVEIVVADVKERLEEDALLRLLPGIDGIIAGDDRLSRRVLENAPSVKVLSKWGTGIDSFDLQAAADLGIEVFNVPNAFSEPVSDSVLGYILAFARNVVTMTEDIRRGVWRKIMGRALNESTVGIIGLGNVGTAVARKLVPFGSRVVYNDVREMEPAETERLVVQSMSLSSLLEQSDFVVVACDLNPTSHHLLSADHFGIMKDSAYLINCARGPIVNQNALVEALQFQQISGAALDVFEEEPLEDDSPLKSMQNVLLAPHNSNSSSKAWEATHRAAIRNLFRGLKIEDKTGEL